MSLYSHTFTSPAGEQIDFKMDARQEGKLTFSLSRETWGRKAKLELEFHQPVGHKLTGHTVRCTAVPQAVACLTLCGSALVSAALDCYNNSADWQGFKECMAAQGHTLGMGAVTCLAGCLTFH